MDAPKMTIGARPGCQASRYPSEDALPRIHPGSTLDLPWIYRASHYPPEDVCLRHVGEDKGLPALKQDPDGLLPHGGARVI